MFDKIYTMKKEVDIKKVRLANLSSDIADPDVRDGELIIDMSSLSKPLKKKRLHKYIDAMEQAGQDDPVRIVFKNDSGETVACSDYPDFEAIPLFCYDMEVIDINGNASVYDYIVDHTRDGVELTVACGEKEVTPSNIRPVRRKSFDGAHRTVREFLKLRKNSPVRINIHCNDKYGISSVTLIDYGNFKEIPKICLDMMVIDSRPADYIACLDESTHDTFYRNGILINAFCSEDPRLLSDRRRIAPIYSDEYNPYDKDTEQISGVITLEEQLKLFPSAYLIEMVLNRAIKMNVYPVKDVPKKYMCCPVIAIREGENAIEVVIDESKADNDEEK